MSPWGLSASGVMMTTESSRPEGRLGPLGFPFQSGMFRNVPVLFAASLPAVPSQNQSSFLAPVQQNTLDGKPCVLSPPFQIIPNFSPPLEAHVRHGVFSSLNHIVEKRVLA